MSFWIDALLHSFSQILFQTSRRCGLVLLLAIGLESTTLLLGGLSGCAMALLGARLSGYEPARIQAGHFGFNGALVGLALSHLFGLSAATELLIALCALLCAPLVELQTRRWSLPPYTSAFVMLSWCACLLAPAFNLTLPGPLPQPHGSGGAFDVLITAIGGLGQILFLGSTQAGWLVLAALLVSACRDAVWAMTGALLGTLLAGWLQFSIPELQAGLFGYNGALAALALAHCFPRHPPVVLVGSALATLLQPLLALSGLPPFTAPFVISCWLLSILAKALQYRPDDAR